MLFFYVFFSFSVISCQREVLGDDTGKPIPVMLAFDEPLDANDLIDQLSVIQREVLVTTFLSGCHLLWWGTSNTPGNESWCHHGELLPFL